MKLPLETRLVIVSTGPDGVVIQPEYWWQGQCIEQLPSRTLRAGEELWYGPHETDVQFHPPIVPSVQSGNHGE